MRRIKSSGLMFGAIAPLIIACSSREKERTLDTAGDTSSVLTVGENVLMSGARADRAHFEFLAAADPANPNRLMASVLLHGKDRALSGSPIVYRSVDGGRTWEVTEFETRGPDVADNAIAYGFGDTVYFASVWRWMGPNADSIDHAVYRSLNGGKTFGKPVYVTRMLFDRQYLAVDRSDGPHRGRIFMYAGQHLGSRKYAGESLKSVLFRSVDGGTNFLGPVEPPGPLNEYSLVNAGGFFTDGSFIIPVWNRRGGKEVIGTMITADGGETLSPVEVLPSFTPCGGITPGPGGWGGMQMALAVDNSSGPFKDRVHMAWYDNSLGTCQVFASHSDDRGKTWSRASLVSVYDPRKAKLAIPENFMPFLAVNKDGIVALSWYSRGGLADSLAATPRMSVSMDGGVTWTPEVTLASEAPKLPINPLPAIYAFANTDYSGRNPKHDSGAPHEIRISVSNNSQGPYILGDTQMMLADATGVFHPMWIDYRSGVPQMWTSAITVKGRAVVNGDPGLDAYRDVTDAIKLEFKRDPGFDWNGHVLTIEVRLKNTSNAPISGPVKLRMTSLGSRLGGNITALGANNGKPDVGAVWDFMNAGETLSPGGASPFLTMRFRVDSLTIPVIHRSVSLTPVALFECRILAPGK
jgi:hypothetical protein